MTFGTARDWDRLFLFEHDLDVIRGTHRSGLSLNIYFKDFNKLTLTSGTSYLMTGDTKVAARKEMEDDFNRILQVWRFKPTLTTAVVPNRAYFLLQPEWDEMIQLIKRCYRQGQKKEVQFFLLVMENSLEEDVLRTCLKGALADLVLTGETSRRRFYRPDQSSSFQRSAKIRALNLRIE